MSESQPTEQTRPQRQQKETPYFPIYDAGSIVFKNAVVKVLGEGANGPSQTIGVNTNK